MSTIAPTHASPVEIRTQGAVRSHQHPQSQVELSAMDEERVRNILLSHLQLKPPVTAFSQLPLLSLLPRIPERLVCWQQDQPLPCGRRIEVVESG